MSTTTALSTNGKRPAGDDDPWAGVDLGQEERRQGPPVRRPVPAAPPFELVWRKPTGRFGWPFVLVAGDEYAGKSTLLAKFCATEEVGTCWWLPLGEDPDPHGVIAPDFRIPPLDGTYSNLMATARAIADYCRAERAADPDCKPAVIAVDAGSALWKALSAWVDRRAQSSDAARAKLARDPDAEIKAQREHWNAANKRWDAFIAVLKEAPAIVVMTTRGGWVSGTDEKGQPTKERVWSINCQKETGYASTAYVRLSREAAPALIGVRLPRGGIVPGAKGPAGEPFIFDGVKRAGRPALTAENFSLTWLVFLLLKFDVKNVGEHRTYDAIPDEVRTPDELPAGDEPRIEPKDGATEAPGATPPAEIAPTTSKGETL